MLYCFDMTVNESTAQHDKLEQRDKLEQQDNLERHDSFEQWLQAISDAAIAEIPQDGTPLSEYELIKRLSGSPYHLFDRELLRSPETGFQIHFPLFHCLYRLQGQLRQETGQHLQISALCIRLVSDPAMAQERSQNGNSAFPSQEGSGKPTHDLRAQDPLAAYYLDIDNFHNSSLDSIRDLVDRFWRRVTRAVSLQEEEALARLGCQPGASRNEIKQAYRRKAQEQHPDRGGNPDHFRAIREAYESLLMT